MFLQHIYYLVFAVQSLQCNNYNDQAQVLIKKACRHRPAIILRPGLAQYTTARLPLPCCNVTAWRYPRVAPSPGPRQKINVVEIAGQ